MGVNFDHDRDNARAKAKTRVYYSIKGPDGKNAHVNPMPIGPRRKAALRARRLSSMK